MRMKYILIHFIVLLFFHFSVFAEEKDNAEFDSIYIHIATVMSVQNMDSAIVLGNTLLKESEGNSIRSMKSLLLLASLELDIGEVLSALVYATKVEKIALKEKNIDWQMRIAGFLYYIYTEIGLTEKGKEYLKKVERFNKSQKNDLIQLTIHHGKANFYLEDSLPLKSLEEIKKTDSLLVKIKSEKTEPIFVATSFLIKGLSYSQLNLLDQAKENLFKAKDALQNDYNILLGYIYVSLANVFLKENNLEKTHLYLIKTKPVLEGSRDYKLKLLLNEAWKNYYLRTNNPLLVKQYEQSILLMKSERTTNLAELSNQLILEFKKESAEKTKSSILLISIISSLIILIVMIVIYNIDRRKQQQKKYENIVTEVKDWFEDE